MKNEKKLFFYYTTHYLDIYLKKLLGRSNETIRSYRDALICFRRYLYNERKISIRKFMLSNCTRELVMEYIEYLRNSNYEISTINHRITVIKNYLLYIADIDITYQGIAITISRIPSLRTPKKEKPCLDDAMLTHLFEAPRNNKIGIRNRTIMILLYDTAVRLSELIHIEIHQLFLNVQEPHIYINGKGDKERIVPISQQAIKHLKYYMSIYHKDNNCCYLFYTTIKGNTNHLSPSTIETFIQNYADEVRKVIPSIPLHVHPHMFRRSRSTKLYQEGIPLELISRLLGHTSMETTKTYYATPSIEMLRSAIVDDVLESQGEAVWEKSEDEIVKKFGLR